MVDNSSVFITPFLKIFIHLKKKKHTQKGHFLIGGEKGTPWALCVHAPGYST